MLKTFFKTMAEWRGAIIDALCTIESKRIAYLSVGYLLANVFALFLPLVTSAIFTFGAAWCIDQFFHWFKGGWENRLKWYDIILLGVGCICGVLSRL